MTKKSQANTDLLIFDQATGSWIESEEGKSLFLILGIDCSNILEERALKLMENPNNNVGKLFPGLILQVLARNVDLFPGNYALTLSLVDGPRYGAIPGRSMPLGYFHEYELYLVGEGDGESRALFSRYGNGDCHISYPLDNEGTPDGHYCAAILEARRRHDVIMDLINTDTSAAKMLADRNYSLPGGIAPVHR